MPEEILRAARATCDASLLVWKRVGVLIVPVLFLVECTVGRTHTDCLHHRSHAPAAAAAAAGLSAVAPMALSTGEAAAAVAPATAELASATVVAGGVVVAAGVLSVGAAAC